MILGVCGSPRKQATEYVLTKALDVLKDAGFATEFFSVRGKNIGFCQHCDYCLKHKECKLNDDMQTLVSVAQRSQRDLFLPHLSITAG